MKPKPRMAIAVRLGCLLICSFAAPALAGSVWIPEGNLFEPLLAGSKESLNYISFNEVRADDLEFTGGFIGLGASFGLYRRDTQDLGSWQIDLFSTIQSQFNMDTSSDDLLNTDFIVGLPFSWRGGNWSARLRPYHQSSHLGDEFLLSGDAPPREDLSFEAVDLLLAHQWPMGLRVYAGGRSLLRTRLETIPDFGYEVGLEYIAPSRHFLGGRPVVSVDVNEAKSAEAALSSKGLIGLQWGETRPDRLQITFAAQMYDGPTPFGQFFDVRTRFYGLVLLFSRQ